MFTDRSLNFFTSVVKAGGITRAAENLHVTQPAVSNAIIKLERELKVTLFTRRKGSPLTLTAQGREVLQLALGMQELERRLYAVAQEPSRQRGTLKIGALTSLIAVFLLPALERFHRLYPKIAFKLSEGTPSRLEAALLDGEIELALSCPPYTAAQAHVLKKDRLIAISNPESTEANLPAVLDLKALSLPVIINRPALETLKAQAPKLNVEALELTVVENAETEIAMVRRGLGLGLTSACTREILCPELTLLEIKPRAHFEIVLLAADFKALSCEAQRFCTLLTQMNAAAEPELGA